MSDVIDTLSLKIVSDAYEASEGIDTLIESLEDLNFTLGRVRGEGVSNFNKQTKKMISGNNNLARSYKKPMKASVAFSLGITKIAARIGLYYASVRALTNALGGLARGLESAADYYEAFNYQNVVSQKIMSETQNWIHDWSKLGYESAEAYGQSFVDGMDEVLKKMSGQKLDENGMLVSTGAANLGMSATELTQYSSNLLAITNSLGFTNEAAYTTSEAFVKLAGDLSSLKNIDTATVMQNLTSALNGQTVVARKYGIDISVARMQEELFAMGINRTVNSLTQSEKAQLRMLLILRQSEVAYGDLANSLNSTSNQMRMLKNNFAVLGNAFASLFIPLANRVLPVINGIVIALQRLVAWVGRLFGIKIDLSDFSVGYTEMESGLEGVADAYDDATASAKKFNKQLRGWDERNNLTSAQSSGGSSDTGSAMGGLDFTDEMQKSLEKYNEVWNKAFENMKNKAVEFADKLTIIAKHPVFQAVAKGLASILVNLGLFKIGYGVFSIIDKISTAWSNLSLMAKAGINLLVQVAGLTVAYESLKGFSEYVFEQFGNKEDLEEAAKLALGDFWGTLYANAVATFGGGYKWSDIWQALLTPETWEDVIDNIKVGWGIMIDYIWEGIKKVGAFFKDIFDTIRDIFDNAISRAKAKVIIFWIDVKKAFSDGWNKIVSFFTVSIPNWFNTKIKPWFTKEKWSEMFEKAMNGLRSVWNTFAQWFSETALGRMFTKVTNFFSTQNWTFSGIKDGLSNAFTAAFEGVKQLWNSFAGWLNDHLQWDVPPVTIAGKTLFAGASIDLGFIPTFANGGYPSSNYGSLFIAGESGAELVGNINGKTGVASNMEITGISESVYSIGASIVNTLNATNSLLMEVRDKTGITSGQVFKAVRQEAYAYTNRTGNSAF